MPSYAHSMLACSFPVRMLCTVHTGSLSAPYLPPVSQPERRWLSATPYTLPFQVLRIPVCASTPAGRTSSLNQRPGTPKPPPPRPTSGPSAVAATTRLLEHATAASH